MISQACLNGWRTPDESANIPVTADQLASEARAAVGAGADSIHLHPKDAFGSDSLEPARVADAVASTRASIGDVPVGVTTGTWAAVDPRQRQRLVAAWTVLPDFASVNWHEEGSVELADLLLERGVGVEAGLHSPEAVAVWGGWARRDRTTRVLLEVVAATSPDEAVAQAHALLTAFAATGASVPVLLHGENAGCWPVFDLAIARGLGWRIGLEDTLTLPNGRLADGNDELVAAAFARAAG